MQAGHRTAVIAMNLRTPSFCALTLVLLSSGEALAARGNPASTQPLAPAPATPVEQPLQHQTGMVVLEGPDGQRTIIRSLEPRSLVGSDRLDFRVLDANGDGVVDRNEAGIERELRRHFDSVDRDRDGVLDREELVDWIL